MAVTASVWSRRGQVTSRALPFASASRDVYDDVASLYAPVAVAVLVIVFGGLAFVTWRGRRRRSPPRRGTEHYPLELGFVAVLAATVAVLLVVTFRAQGRVEARGAAPAAEVRIVAAKWNWRFEYPRLGIVETGSNGAPAVLTVPVGGDVAFTATSLDVIHGFWLPDLRFQRELIPQRTIAFRMHFDHPLVTSNAACSFYCGLYHARMRFVVRALSRAEFAAWARRGGRG